MICFAPSATGHRQPSSQTDFIFSLPTLDLTATQSFDDCGNPEAANYIFYYNAFSVLQIGFRDRCITDFTVVIRQGWCCKRQIKVLLHAHQSPVSFYGFTLMVQTDQSLDKQEFSRGMDGLGQRRAGWKCQVFVVILGPYVSNLRALCTLA
ncbi:hypothetical protein AMECASPLE_009506 [Ameca splendens]|uniref:Uncharacterized protein n=1 Tax=Ameca splendens TaxID=208324 RepID=A0ABV0ZL07_9TELE